MPMGGPQAHVNSESPAGVLSAIAFFHQLRRATEALVAILAWTANLKGGIYGCKKGG
jgi:hypothetical protein